MHFGDHLGNRCLRPLGGAMAADDLRKIVPEHPASPHNQIVQSFPQLWEVKVRKRHQPHTCHYYNSFRSKQAKL
jgi:hypothetical protein